VHPAIKGGVQTAVIGACVVIMVGINVGAAVVQTVVGAAVVKTVVGAAVVKTVVGAAVVQTVVGAAVAPLKQIQSPGWRALQFMYGFIA